MLHRTTSFTRSLLFLQVVVILTPSGGVKNFRGPLQSPNHTQTQPLPVICKDGWKAALAENLDGGQSTNICIKLNSQSLTWEQSRDICRNNQAFLLKLDKRVNVGVLTLEQYIQNEQLSSYWTGLHEDESKLVWDEYKQSIVQAYIGPHAGYGKIKRGWRWNSDSFAHVDDSCGVISLNHTHNRHSRSATDYDDIMQARHGIDLDLPDSAPVGFQQSNLQHFIPPEPNSGEKVLLDSLESQPTRIVVTEAPDPSSQVTESSETENSNPREDGIVKRSTMRRIEVTESPQSSDDDDSEEVTIAPSTVKPSSVSTGTEVPSSNTSGGPSTVNKNSHEEITTVTSSTTTSSAPSTSTSSSTSPRTTTSTSTTTSTAKTTTITSTITKPTTVTTTTKTITTTTKPTTVTTTTKPTTVTTTTKPTTMTTKTTPITPTTKPKTTKTPKTTTITPTTETSTVTSGTTITSTTTILSPTTIWKSMQNNKITFEANIGVTPSTVGTSKRVNPSTKEAAKPTTPSTMTTKAPTTTKWKPSRASTPTKISPKTTVTTTKTTQQTSTTTTDLPVSVRGGSHVDLGGLVMPHADRLTSEANALDPDVTQVPALGDTIQYMNLESCNAFHPSICFTEPIESLQQVSFCGPGGWVGHPQVDKCYKILTFPMNFELAKNQCVRQGGTLASVDSDYYGNLTTMAYLQFRNINPTVSPNAWVDVFGHDKVRLTGGCSALNNRDIIQLDCQRRMFSVCEKLALLRNFELPISPSLLHEKQRLYMLSKRPRQITCPISTATPEEQVLWFKDGVLIQDNTNSRTFPRFSNAATQQRAKTLYLNMTLLRRLAANSGRNVVHQSLLQGNYWCEVWRLSPFRKVKSPKFLVIFTDVITLHGTLQTRGIPVNTSVIFNYMNRPADVPLEVAQDLDIINRNISRSMSMADPVLTDIASYVDNVNPDTGVINFFVQLTLDRIIPENRKENIVSLYLRTLHTVLTPLSSDLVPLWNLSVPVTEAITLTRIDYCPPAYLKDENTGFFAQFPKSPVGNNVDSVETCDGVPIGYAFCRGDYETGAYWEDWSVDTNCQKPLTSQLSVTDSDDLLHNLMPNNTDQFGIHDPRIPLFHLSPSKALVQLDQIEIENGNVMDVTAKMAEIIDKTSDLTDADINACAEVISRIVKVTPPAHKIGHQLMKTVNRILDADVAAIMSAQRKTRAATRIIDNLERFSMKTDIGSDKSMRLVTPNVAMEVWDLDRDMAPVIGLGAKVGGSWTQPLTDPRILTIWDRSDSMLAGFDVAIELPQQLVLEAMNGQNSTRLSMLIYRKTGLFSPVVNSSLGVVNSAIISATLGGKEIRGLNDMIRMAFRPFVDAEYHIKKTKCAYWDFELNHDMGGWSDTGCHYNGTMYGLDICMCDHLTNFAVLLDFYGHSKPIEPAHELTLSIISLVGLSLSIFGLALTIITFIFFKKLRQGRAQQTLFHMAIALLCSKVVFLVGIKQTNNEYFCLSVAVLLHYFILVSFLWMLIEAILQYMTFVKILGTYVSRYALKTIIPAWGLPLIPVTCVLAIDYNMYRGREAYCWMGMEAFYYAFALPVGVIVVINIVMFIIILINLVRRPDGLRSTQSKQNRAKMHLKAAVTIFVLLGLTWIFGFLQIEDARIVFQYIFTFLSSLQGFFIFILLVARRKQVREQWLLLCCNKKEGRRAPKQVSPTNSNSTSSNGSGGSLSLHNSSTRTLRTNINRESFDSVYYIPSRRPPPPYKAL